MSSGPIVSAEPVSASAGSGRVVLAGAMNETLSFQFAAHAPAVPVAQPSLRLADFRSAAGAARTFGSDLYRMHPVQVGPLPGWHIRSIPPDHRELSPLDALAPLAAPSGGLPATLEPNALYYFWVDVHVPKGIDQGVYTSRVELSAGAAVIGAVDVEIRVWPFVLPDVARVVAIGELDHRALIRELAATWGDPTVSAEFWQNHPRATAINAQLHDTVRVLHDHRITAVLPGLAPRVSMRASGDVSLDWSAFDAVMGPVMSGELFEDRLGAATLPIPLAEAMSALAGRPGSEILLRRYLTQTAIHFKERGWLNRAYAVVPATKVPGAGDYESARELAELVKTATAGDLRVATALIPQDMRGYGWHAQSHADLGDVVDIWLPPAQFFDPMALQKELDRGRHVWLSADRPPFSGTAALGAPDAYSRVLGWQSVALGADSLYLGRLNEWPLGVAADSPDSCAGHDPRALLYPGRRFGLPGPIPSVRLKRLRRSMQDLAYLRLLEDHGLGHIGRAVTLALVWGGGATAYRTHFADGKPIPWIDDPARFELAREVMAEELTRAVGGPVAERASDTFTRSAAWLRLMDERRRVTLRAEGVRVRLAGSPFHPQADAQAAVTIDNTSRLPAGGELTLSGLPPGLDGAATPVADVGPGQSVALSPSARGPLADLLAGMARDLSIDLRAQGASLSSTTARLALATAEEGSTARIDGDLSDWPTQGAGVLNGFQRVSPACEHNPGRLPVYGTTAWVRRDDRALYFALICESQPDPARGMARKSVRYEDMIPVGEELVEILIDPLNLGTRSPADLYHLVIKRSGSDLAEKGVGFDPPVFERSPWAADIDVAVRDEGSRWIAETRIPFEAFTPGPHRHEIWGLNVTRFDAANQEFSTWSGAEGNAYDPLSLGNLYLP